MQYKIKFNYFFSTQTKIKDLESDYYQLENNIFLSPEDRKLIIERKDELKKIALKNKKKIIFDLDLINQCTTEKKVLNFSYQNFILKTSQKN